MQVAVLGSIYVSFDIGVGFLGKAKWHFNQPPPAEFLPRFRRHKHVGEIGRLLYRSRGCLRQAGVAFVAKRFSLEFRLDKWKGLGTLAGALH